MAALKKTIKAVTSARSNPASTKEKGDLFENEVAEVFRFMTGAIVTMHKKIAGKDVDVYVTLKNPIFGETKIAVDAKDYAKSLSRDRAAAELSSYHSLVANGHVDQFILITRHGIVANAKEIFDGKKTSHFTISELRRLVFDPNRLIEDMEYQFSSDKLDQYYVNTTCYNVDIEKAFENYDLYYNEFIAFSLSKYTSDLAAAQEAWISAGNRQFSIIEKYSKPTFESALTFRKGSKEITELEPLIEKWLESHSLDIGIALLGTYGTGKSSFARKIAHKAAINYKLGKSKRIPLLIELKNFSSHQSIDGLITHTLVNNHGITGGSYMLFKKMNASGNFFLILDGFDEMKHGMTKDALIYNFNQLNSLCQGNARVLLCGRPTMFESEEEKTSIFSGETILDVPTRARYIPIDIAPLHVDAIMKMMINYVRAKEPKQVSIFAKKTKNMKDAIQKSPELTDLLSRPVHVPMFVTILPEYKGDIGDLNRAFLYESFIRKIIHREVTKLNQAYQRRYSIDQRFQFVGSLALELAKMGEVRSIRRSEIPASIVLPLVNEGDTIEIAKRDLLAACFVEQKPPDIVSFAHKSFLEFLAAFHSLQVIRGSAHESANSLIYPTKEIASFFIDLLGRKDIDGTISNQPDGSWDFLLACLLLATAKIQLFDPVPYSDRDQPRRLLLMVPATEKTILVLDWIFSSDTLEKAARVNWPQKNRREFLSIFFRGLFAYTEREEADYQRVSQLARRDAQYQRLSLLARGAVPIFERNLAKMKANNPGVMDQMLSIVKVTLGDSKIVQDFKDEVFAGRISTFLRMHPSEVIARQLSKFSGPPNSPFKAVVSKST